MRWRIKPTESETRAMKISSKTFLFGIYLIGDDDEEEED